MTGQALATSGAAAEGDGRSKKYQVLMELGRGGAGVVSAAISRGIGGFRKLVVLKTPKPDSSDPDGDSDNSDTAKLLLNEARLSARMQHPNIVQVYEVYEEEGLPVIVMEHLDGLSLAKIMPRLWRHEEPVIELMLTIVCRVLEALSYAHSLTDFGGEPLGIVHRDVSPHNVMITYEGQVKLLDFGTAKLSRKQSHETRAGVIKGKLGYMPPEQVCGIALDGRADVFAVGVVLWEMLAKRRMWANLGEAEIIRELLSDSIPALSKVAPDLDPQLREICDKALAPDAEHRYASAAALLGDLQHYLAARGGAVPDSVISDLIGQTCSDLRQAAQQRLEKELAKLSNEGEDSWDDSGSEETVTAARRAVEASSSGARALMAAKRKANATSRAFDHADAETLTHERRPVPRRSRLWWAVTAALLGGGGWALAAQQGWSLTHAATLAAAPVTTAPLAAPTLASSGDTAPEPKPADVRFSVSAEPAQARVYLDDQLVTNPYRAVHARDGSAHVLRVESDGHVPIVRDVRFDADMDLVFSLSVAAPAQPTVVARAEVEKPAPSARKRPVSRKTGAVEKPAAAALGTPTAAPDCDPPYYFDEQGIKRYRRECLDK